MLIQVTTVYYRLLQVTTGYYSLLQVTTVYCRLLQVIISFYRLIQITRVYYRVLQICHFTTSYFFTIYQGCSFEDYLASIAMVLSKHSFHLHNFIKDDIKCLVHLQIIFMLGNSNFILYLSHK